MVLNSSGCLFPDSNPQGLRVRQCTPETCDTHILYSVVSARCPSGVRNASTSDSLPSLPSSEIVRTRCMVNRTTEVFYWFPPVQDCFSGRWESILPIILNSHIVSGLLLLPFAQDDIIPVKFVYLTCRHIDGSINYVAEMRITLMSLSWHSSNRHFLLLLTLTRSPELHVK